MNKAEHIDHRCRVLMKNLVPGIVFWMTTAFLLSLSVISVAQVSLQQGPDGYPDETLKPAQQDGKWGYVAPFGKFLISSQYESAGHFSERLAAVELNGRFGYISPNGQFVIQPKYFGAGPFKDGFAWVVTKKPLAPFGRGEYGAALFGQVTYIDHFGRELMRPFSAEHVSNFSEGLAAVRPGKIVGGCSEKVGYVDTRGQWAIKPQFDEARDFSEGLAAINQGGKCHMGGKWGYIDKDGRAAIPLQYDFAGQFKNGHACVEEAETWQLIDAKGNGAQ
jgi:WG containing repeat